MAGGRAKSGAGRFFAVLLFLALPPKGEAQDWYRSNPSGMALERISSRMVALHHEWALSVEKPGSASLPPVLRPYYRSSYTPESRLLYERGKLKRRQWIFRDENGTTRLNASLSADLASMGKSSEEGGEIPPFIEVFAADRSLTEIHQYLAAGIYTTRFSYRENMLIRSDTFLDNKPLWTDQYRYTRSRILRGVERDYHEAGASAAALGSGLPPPNGLASAGPPASLPPAVLDIREAPPIPGFVSPGAPYDYSIMANVLTEVYALPADRVVYDTDSQGRVLAETRYDGEGNILAQINNEWSGSKITVIRWTAGANQGRIVFSYSGEDRIGEEDYKNGVLERRVSRQGDGEIEEIYMDGKAILRAQWREGRKVSEERLR